MITHLTDAQAAFLAALLAFLVYALAYAAVEEVWGS